MRSAAGAFFSTDSLYMLKAYSEESGAAFSYASRHSSARSMFSLSKATSIILSRIMIPLGEVLYACLKRMVALSYSLASM